MTPEELHLRDEILQVLYWLKGEGLQEEASAEQLAVFLPASNDELEPVIRSMVTIGMLEPGKGAGTCRLNELGLAEGGRRFAEAFADAGLGIQGHGTCMPGCDCELHGPEACSLHGHGGDDLK